MTRLQEQGKKKGITQKEFSRLTNISVRSIQDLEQGRVKIENCNLHTLVKFGQILGVPFIMVLEDLDFARRVGEQCGAGPEAGARTGAAKAPCA